MKKKFYYILTILIVFILFILIKNLVIDKPEETGRLRVVSSPIAGVFIDNIPLGNTPIEVKYKPGEYSLKLIPEGEGGKTTSWEGKIQINPHILTYVIRDLGDTDLSSGGEILTVKKGDRLSPGSFGGITVSSLPPGAIIYLNGDEKGITPISLLDVPTGEHELSISLPGFIKRSQKILVTKGHFVDVQFKLALDPEYKTLDQVLKSTQENEASNEAKLENDAITPLITSTTESKLLILETESGFLNVRNEPRINSSQIDQVRSGEEYIYKNTLNNWYLIVLSDGQEGWVSGEYIKIK